MKVFLHNIVSIFSPTTHGGRDYRDMKSVIPGIILTDGVTGRHNVLFDKNFSVFGPLEVIADESPDSESNMLIQGMTDNMMEALIERGMLSLR